MEPVKLSLAQGEIEAAVPGVYPGLAPEQYHALPGIGHTGLGTIVMRSEAHYAFGVREETEQMRNGTLRHVELLEPGAFDGRYCVMPDDIVRNIKHEKYRTWIAKAADLDYIPDAEEAQRILDGDTEDKCKVLVKDKDVAQAKAIAAKVKRHPRWKAMVEGAEWVMYEPTLLWTDPRWPNVLLRSRPDVLAHWRGKLLAIDLKTVATANPENIGRLADQGTWGLQAHMMQEGCRAVFGVQAHAVYFCVEYGEPHVCEAYQLGDPEAVMPWTTLGREQFEGGLDRYTKALESGHWPTYRDGKLDDLPFPRWKERDLNTIEAAQETRDYERAASALGEE